MEYALGFFIGLSLGTMFWIILANFKKSDNSSMEKLHYFWGRSNHLQEERNIELHAIAVVLQDLCLIEADRTKKP